MDRLDIKKQEAARLNEACRANPELFKQASYVEDSAFLRDFGIIIPGKEKFPLGYLKLYPSDFIVEEIREDGSVCDIGKPAFSGSVEPLSEAPKNESQRALFATLVKCNISTLEAVEEMSQKLGCKSDSIRYAGLKDKNAITSQAVSFHGVDFEKAANLSGSHYFLKDFRFGKGSVDKGGLEGNRFTIFVRTPDIVAQEDFSNRAKSLSESGFYNFYWLQRFGAPRLVNFRWGFDILRGRYKEAVLGYLSDATVRELPFFADFRKNISSAFYDWQKIKAMIEPYPIIMFNENRMVDYLMKNPEDYLGTLCTVEDQVMLWVYGFASLLFNESLSSYIRSGADMPADIPLLISNQKDDIDFYAPLLESVKYYPPNFKNIRSFPKIQLRHRTVACREKISVEKTAFMPDGVVLRFILKKGQYATAFLSHLFNLISGYPPAEISNDSLDTSLAMGNALTDGTLDYFREVNISRKDSSFERLGQEL